jgi:hypothetical protein
MIEVNEHASPLIRTWFEDDDAWVRLVAAVKSPEEDGLFAYVQIIDDRDGEHMSLEDLAGLHPVPTDISMAIVADRQSMSEPEYPLLVLLANGNVPPEHFRVIAKKLYEVEINVHALANLDWADFAHAVDADGVFRGFSH